MKISTAAIAFGSPLLVLTVKTVFEPTWLHDFSLAACIVVGSVMGLFAGFAMRVIDPRD